MEILWSRRARPVRGREADRRPDAGGRVLDRAGGAVLPENPLHEVEPQAAAARRAVPGPLLAEKGLEEVGQRFTAHFGEILKIELK